MSDKDKKLADSIVDELLSGSSAKERPEEKDLSSDIVNELLGGDVTPKVVEPEKPKTTNLGQDILRSLRDVGYSAQSGLFTGLSAIPGVFGDVETLARQAGRALNYDIDPDSVFPTTKEYTEMAIPKALGATYVPETTTGRMVKAPVEFGTAMLGGGPFVRGGKEIAKALGRDVATELPSVAGPSLARQALQSAPLRIGAPAGLTAAGVTEVTDSEGLGGVAGGAQAIAQSLIQSRTRPAAAARMMREALEGADISAAKTLEAQSKQLGVPLTAAETISAPKLQTLAEKVAMSESGAGILAPRMAGRGREIEDVVSRGLLAIDEAPIRPTALASEVQETAQKAINRVEKARSAIANRGGYGKLSEAIVPDAKAKITSLIDAISEEAATAPKGGEIQKSAKRFMRLLENPDDVSVTAKNLDQVRKEMQAIVKKEGQIKGTIGPLVSQLKDVLDTVPEFRGGKEAYKKFSNTIMKDFDGTGIRKMAEDGITSRRIANLVSNPELVRPVDIQKIAKAMNKQNPDTFPKIVKFLVESETEKALTKAKPGEKVEGALRKGFLGRPNFEALLKGVAEAKGQDPEQFVQGVNNMLDVLKATSAVPKLSAVKAPAPSTPATVSGAVKKITGAEVTRPVGLLSDVIEKPSEVAYRSIAKALASDDSIDAVIRLANMNPSSQLAKNLVGSLMGVSAASQSGLLAGD